MWMPEQARPDANNTSSSYAMFLSPADSESLRPAALPHCPGINALGRAAPPGVMGVQDALPVIFCREGEIS